MQFVAFSTFPPTVWRMEAQTYTMKQLGCRKKARIVSTILHACTRLFERVFFPWTHLLDVGVSRPRVCPYRVGRPGPTPAQPHKVVFQMPSLPGAPSLEENPISISLLLFVPYRERNGSIGRARRTELRWIWTTARVDDGLTWKSVQSSHNLHITSRQEVADNIWKVFPQQFQCDTNTREFYTLFSCWEQCLYVRALQKWPVNMCHIIVADWTLVFRIACYVLMLLFLCSSVFPAKATRVWMLLLAKGWRWWGWGSHKIPAEWPRLQFRSRHSG